MQYLLKDEARRDDVLKHIQSLNLDESYEIIVQPYKKIRSKAQNRTLWSFYKPIADYTGYTEEELHEVFKAACIGFEVFTYNGEKYMKPKTSTRLTIKGMTKMLEKVILVANFLQVGLPIPDDYKENLNRY